MFPNKYAQVGTVITKDLSRLARNSALTGLYINYTFPQYGVRYIAVNDHFDTIDPNSTDNDIAGIKNWFNNIYYISTVYTNGTKPHIESKTICNNIATRTAVTDGFLFSM